MPGAVGRISYGTAEPKPGAAICTGTLVAPDLVLTARHCLEKAKGNPGNVRFEPGLTGPRHSALGQGAEVILPEAAVTPDRGNDAALLRLAAPIPAEAVTPLPLATSAQALQAASYSLFDYRRDAPDQPEPGRTCRHLGDHPGVLALSCPVVSGNSGAALLIAQDGGWRVAAVMVATVGGEPVHALAALIPEDLQRRIPPPP